MKLSAVSRDPVNKPGNSRSRAAKIRSFLHFAGRHLTEKQERLCRAMARTTSTSNKKAGNAAGLHDQLIEELRANY
jgi:hypothetical protein